LEPTKGDVLNRFNQLVAEGASDIDPALQATAGLPFYNTSPLNFRALLADPYSIAANLRSYINGFSAPVVDVLAAYDFDTQIARLEEARLLYSVVGRFAEFDLRPQVVSDRRMEAVFEDLVQAVSVINYEVAGEHFTPREVSRLMAELVLAADKDTGGQTIYDPACGAGGTLLEATRQLETRNPHAPVEAYGQEINSETYAICRSAMLMKGGGPSRIALGNSLSQDRFPGARFDYLVAAPPFGMDWKKVAVFIEDEAMLGFAGRFGAGLPRINDASLLFLQHMTSKMKRPEDGGSRIAIIFNGSPLDVGAAGSGESEIRRWILENDLLEGVVAVPDQLFYNTGIATYLWILTNRKDDQRRGKVVLLNASDEWQKMRRPRGGKRKYVASDQIDAITDAYRNAAAISHDTHHPWHARVRVLRNEEFAYRKIVIDRPLRARFELTEENLSRLTKSAAFQNVADPDGLAAALRPLIGTTWDTRNKALGALRAAAKAGRQSWPTAAAFGKLVIRTIRNTDPQGEIQKSGGAIEPDPALSVSVNLPANRDPQDYLRDEVQPRHPDAWIDVAKTRIGYEISLTHFFVRPIDAEFDHLKRFARVETAKVKLSGEDGSGGGWPFLSVQDLHDVDSAVALPEAPAYKAAPLTPCRGGDLVGWPGNWRLLPPNFGEAVTSMYVLHPLGGRGRLLSEWLNSRPDNPYAYRMTSRKLMDIQVPVDFVDEEIDDLLEAVQEGRRKIQAAASNTLPNVFSGAQTDVQRLRDEIRSAAYEARLVAELMRPVEDPIGRAEWSYPYHISSLARRYRISAHPAEQKDGLLKLGEGIARVLGILALSEIIANEGFPPAIRKQFRSGATFGTWTTILNKFADGINVPRLPGLVRLANSDGVSAVLSAIKNVRNNSHHSHGVRTSHEIERDVETLEPQVVSAITAVSWLAGNPWDWVERCEYLGESSYRIAGLTLRGSHPSWEPYDRPSTSPLKPSRIYVNVAGGTPIDLWPLAAVSLRPPEVGEPRVG
jgi:type I restriction enzyme M protein